MKVSVQIKLYDQQGSHMVHFDRVWLEGLCLLGDRDGKQVEIARWNGDRDIWVPVGEYKSYILGHSPLFIAPGVENIGG